MINHKRAAAQVKGAENEVLNKISDQTGFNDPPMHLKDKIELKNLPSVEDLTFMQRLILKHTQNTNNINIEQLLRIPPRNYAEALQDFIDLWCKECDITDLLFGKPIEEIDTLCPKETITTCPYYNKLRAAAKVLQSEPAAPHAASGLGSGTGSGTGSGMGSEDKDKDKDKDKEPLWPPDTFKYM